MSISHSQLECLQSCERKWSFRYQLRLEPAGPMPWNLMRGSAWHAVLAAEAIQFGHELGSLLHFPLEVDIWDGLSVPVYRDDALDIVASAAAVCGAVGDWEREQESEYLDEMRAEYGDLLSVRLWDLWQRYRDGKTSEELFGRPLLVEYAWEREMPNGHVLNGRTDLAYYDAESDLVVVRDSKTHQSWPSTKPAIEDLVNSQLHLNAWGIAPALRDLSPALVPQAVEYDRTRFKKPTAPKLTLKGQLSKSVTDFDAHTYKQWASDKEAVDAGYLFDLEYYGVLLENRESWFRRSRKPMNRNIWSQHVLSAQHQAARATTITPENAALMLGSHCTYCDFSSLCRADLVGGRDPDFVPGDFGLRVRKPRELAVQ